MRAREVQAECGRMSSSSTLRFPNLVHLAWYYLFPITEYSRDRRNCSYAELSATVEEKFPVFGRGFRSEEKSLSVWISSLHVSLAAFDHVRV